VLEKKELQLFSYAPCVALHHSYLSSIDLGVESVCALGAPRCCCFQFW